jgi:hypothetical protein
VNVAVLNLGGGDKFPARPTLRKAANFAIGSGNRFSTLRIEAPGVGIE